METRRTKKTNCVFPRVNTPIMRVRVVCGLFVTIAIFSPSNSFKIEDFPTFGFPTIATNAALETDSFNLFSPFFENEMFSFAPAKEIQNKRRLSIV